MSTYGAILGASIGVILLCLVVVVACYVLYAVSHMKALKALGYKNAWLAWIPYGVFYACADAAAEGEGEKVKLLPVTHESTVDKLLDYVPDLIEKASTLIDIRLGKEESKLTKDIEKKYEEKVVEFENEEPEDDE